MMEEREKLQIGGVLEVISFDEEGVMMETTCGLLVLKGTELHIGKLDLEEGEVTVNGTIDSIDYSDGSAVGGRTHPLLGKLFR
ncbi:MAG: sporulation protein YabP [Anaerotignum sp.]|nr:sporulation protein YabP [Anaerotignum sp.]